jgi:hypothetical protein
MVCDDTSRDLVFTGPTATSRSCAAASVAPPTHMYGTMLCVRRRRKTGAARRRLRASSEQSAVTAADGSPEPTAFTAIESSPDTITSDTATAAYGYPEPTATAAPEPFATVAPEPPATSGGNAVRARRRHRGHGTAARRRRLFYRWIRCHSRPQSFRDVASHGGRGLDGENLRLCDGEDSCEASSFASSFTVMCLFMASEPLFTSLYFVAIKPRPSKILPGFRWV